MALTWDENYKASYIRVSKDGQCASSPQGKCGWVRGSFCARPGQKISWKIKLSRESGGNVFSVGVISSSFSRWEGTYCRNSWLIQNDSVYKDGEFVSFESGNFSAGDILTLVLDRSSKRGILSCFVNGSETAFVEVQNFDVLYPCARVINHQQKLKFDLTGSLTKPAMKRSFS
mmetsp:Transcript_32327/g.44408  ORF Transcript_32327/g.44408 Transcript_32327/m.44408 type:complete len:173 (+) Transcript_32327:92-610(+)